MHATTSTQDGERPATSRMSPAVATSDKPTARPFSSSRSRRLKSMASTRKPRRASAIDWNPEPQTEVHRHAATLPGPRAEALEQGLLLGDLGLKVAEHP